MADPNAVPSVLSLGDTSLSLPNPDYEGKTGGEGAAAYMRAIAVHDVAAKKQEALAKGFEKRRPKEEAETERAYAGAERAAAQPRPPVPQMERVESPPKPEDYQKMSMTYLGAMVMLGAFGGKFIRNAGNAPLAAFNGALKGWQEGNLEAYQQKSAEWKEKQQQVLDNNRARLDEYRTILEDRNASIDDQMLRVKLTAAKHQDKIFYDRADANNWTGVGQAYDQSVAVHEKAVAATDKIVEQLTKDNISAGERAEETKQYLQTPQGQQWLNSLTPGQQAQVKGYVKAYASEPEPTASAPGVTGTTAVPYVPGATPAPAPAPTATPPIPGTGTPAPTTTPAPAPTTEPAPPTAAPGRRHRDFTAYGWPPAAIRDAAAIWNASGAMPTGLGRGHGLEIQGEIRTVAAEMNQQQGKRPEDRANDWMIRKAHQLGLNRYLSGDQSKPITALNTVVSHLNVLRDLGDAMQNGNQPRLNQIYQWIGRNVEGAEQPTDFAVAAQIVGAEVMKALVNTGGGVGEREEMGAAWQQFGSPAQIHGAIETADRLMAGQLRSKRQGFKVATGQPESMFDEMLLPEVKTYFTEVEKRHAEGGGKPAAGAGGGGKPQRVEQNGHIYQLGPDGNYHPVQ